MKGKNNMKSIHYLVVIIAPTLLAGCLEPTSEVFVQDSSVPRGGPAGPAPDASVYHCTSSNGSPCQTPRARMWLPGWIVTMMAARGNKVAFSALPTSSSGEVEPGSSHYAGQLDLTTGNLDWILPLGTDRDDFQYDYDMSITPDGDVVIAASGYGELLLGEGGYQFDGFLAAFDSLGKKRFAKRFEIWDTLPEPQLRPRFVGATIVADDLIRVRTAFFESQGPNYDPMVMHIFSFQNEGTQIGRVAVPLVKNLFWEETHPSRDGSLWIWQAPGPMYHYSKAGDLLDSMDITKDEPLDLADPRGFVPNDAESVLVNLSDNGWTNEIYRFAPGSSSTLLFSEPKGDPFAAAHFRQSLGLTKNYFCEMNGDATVYRIATISAQGHRGPASVVGGVAYRFVIYDDDVGVFYRTNDTGTEFIVQPL